MLSKNEIASLADMTKDLIAHPTIQDGRLQEEDYLKEIIDSEIFTTADVKEINSALKIILGDNKMSDGQKYDTMNNLWKVNYYYKPPTPAEFLSEEWLGATSENIYPYIKEKFIEFFDVTKPYRILNAAAPIGVGKSTFTVLVKLYVTVLLYYLQDWKRYLKKSPHSLIADASVSLNLDMAKDLILTPMTNMMGVSPKFKRVKMEEQLLSKMKEDRSTLYWTTATTGRAFMRVGDYHFVACSDVTHFLGYTITCFSVTEITYLIEHGFTDEAVWRIYTDLKERVFSRFGNHYMARGILDSSPRDMSSKIDSYMYEGYKTDPEVLNFSGYKWDFQPDLFPIYEKDKSKVFPVYVGDASKSPKILTLPEVKDYDVDKVIYIPDDIKRLAENNVARVIQNYAGIPTGMDAKLITNYDMIEDAFVPYLKNFYRYEHAPASLPPEGMLWDIVKKKFFVSLGKNNMYEFYRNPNAQRFISIDLAKKHDMAAISMCHIEHNLKGENVYVVDFSLSIMSTQKDEINLDAFKYLIIDMITYGHINCKIVSFDQFQSDSSRQALIRAGVDVINLSVDRTTEPYMSFINLLQTRNIKMGRNLVMKNNLKSLVQKKDLSNKLKIGHVESSWIDLDNDDWEKSKMGYYGKDLSDSVVASIELAKIYCTEIGYVWNEELEQKKAERDINTVLKEIFTLYNLTPKS